MVYVIVDCILKVYVFAQHAHQARAEQRVRVDGGLHAVRHGPHAAPGRRAARAAHAAPPARTPRRAAHARQSVPLISYSSPSKSGHHSQCTRGQCTMNHTMAA